MFNIPIFIVKIQGGLGNQLFGLAFSRYLRNKNRNAKVWIDSKSSYIYEPFYRNLEISKLLKKEDLLIKNSFLIFLLKFISKLIYKIKKISIFKKYTRFIKEESEFDESIKNNSIQYLDGYWQDKKYLNFLGKEFLEDLIKFTNLSKKKKSKKKLIIGIHYRIKNYDYELSENYYINSLNYILKNIAIKDYSILIFTDDFRKAKVFFGKLHQFKRARIICGEIIEDFKLMTNCHHLIIAKSTLSWWAGIIISEKFKDSIICRPRFFEFSPTEKLNIKRWIIIKD